MLAPLLLLFVVSILIVILGAIIKTSAFTDYNNTHSSFVKRQLSHYGNVPITLIGTDRQGALGTSADAILRTPGVKGKFPLNKKDGIWAIIDKCESIKTMDCNAFDDPEFSLNCGVCLDIGKNHSKAPATGGLVLLPADKKSARNNAQSNLIPDYIPTMGFCPAGKMVSSKEECVRLQRELLCQKNGSFDLPGCSQCYSDISYTIVDPKTSPGVVGSYGRILLIGIGNLSISEEGFPPRTNISLSKNKPYAFDVRATEGMRIKFSVNPPQNSTESNPILPFIAGYMVGRTFSGQWTTDLRQIIITDEVTGRRPRLSGDSTLNTVPITKMSPGFGQTRIILSALIPFTFVDTTSYEASLCKDAPFLTTKASADFLSSDPCYGKNTGPGKYSDDCLQSAWITNGCTSSGKGYPKNIEMKSRLMTAEDGSFRSINDISDYIYNLAIITATGLDENGKKQSIIDWSEASSYCTGNMISSPCDIPTTSNGPLTPDCIVYLWNNQGSRKLWNGQNNPIGPTYYTSDSVSLFQQGSTLRACQPTGTLSPVNADGSIRNNIVAYWQSKGALSTVKQLMADLHRAANAQAVADDQLAPYFTQCYGNIQVAPAYPPAPTPPPPPPPYIPPPPPPQPPSVILGEHCNNSGWQRTLDVGEYKADTDFPSDASYITVQQGLSATLVSGSGQVQQIIGPGEFSFCSRSGFNDNVKQITVAEGNTPPPPPPLPATVILGEHCNNAGWQWKLDVGKHRVYSDFPGDASYITVQQGLSATLLSGTGEVQTVVGPGEFSFCSRGGFNDNVKEIMIAEGNIPPSLLIKIDPNLIYRASDNGYTASGHFATHFPSSTRIILDTRSPVLNDKGDVINYGAPAETPNPGSIIRGPFIAPGTTVVSVENSGRLPSNPYVNGQTVSISKPLVNMKEDRGLVFVYSFTKI